MNCNKIEAKIDQIHEKLSEVEKLQAIHNEILDAHHKRSTMLEEEFKPIRILVYQIVGIGKFLGIVAVSCSIAAFVMKVLGK